MGRAHALELGYANLGASGASRIIRGLPGTLTRGLRRAFQRSRWDRVSVTRGAASSGRSLALSRKLISERGELAMAIDLIDRARVALAAKRFRLREDDRPLGEVTFSAAWSRDAAVPSRRRSPPRTAFSTPLRARGGTACRVSGTWFRLRAFPINSGQAVPGWLSDAGVSILINNSPCAPSCSRSAMLCSCTSLGFSNTSIV